MQDVQFAHHSDDDSSGSTMGASPAMAPPWAAEDDGTAAHSTGQAESALPFPDDFVAPHAGSAGTDGTAADPQAVRSGTQTDAGSPALTLGMASHLFGHLCDQRLGVSGATALLASSPVDEEHPAADRHSAQTYAPPAELLRRVEQHTGARLDQVRVHIGGKAQASAAEYGARAYAQGSDLFFAAGQYRPGTVDGDRLLIHELVHAAQQQGASSGASPAISAPDSAPEQEADAIAHAMTAGDQAAPRSARRPLGRVQAAPFGIYRSPDPETLGTAQTTAPIAKNAIQPQRQMVAELERETSLLRHGQRVIAWIEGKRCQHPDESFEFTIDELFAATQPRTETTGKKKTIQAEIPGIQIKSAAELKPILDILIHYGVINGPSATSKNYTINVETRVPYAAKQLRRSKFDNAHRDITAFTQRFKKRVHAKSPQKSVVETDLAPMEWSSDFSAVKKEKAANIKLTNLSAKMGEYVVYPAAKKGKAQAPIFGAKSATAHEQKDENGKTTGWQIEIAGQAKPLVLSDEPEAIEPLASGTREATLKRREQLQREIKAAQHELHASQAYRTFSKENLVLFKRLRELNTQFSIGTYHGHSWAEFSADIFISAGFDKDAAGFWDRAAVRRFFDDLNTAAEMTDTEEGKFAWRAIYNDHDLAEEINKKYGNERVIHAPHHGPHPDKLHIHLDARPVTLNKDAATGYTMVDGRVHLNEPLAP